MFILLWFKNYFDYFCLIIKKENKKITPQQYAEYAKYLGYNIAIAEINIKKLRQEKLVKGYSPTDVEAKVAKVFESYSEDWRITAIVESKIDEVIE